MSERYGPAVAWVTFTISVVALCGTALLGSRNAQVVAASSAGFELIWVLAWGGFGVVGVVLVQRRPSRPIGWILLAIPTLVYLSLFLAEYAVHGLVVEPGSLPLALAAGWISKWSFAPVVGLLVWLVLLFPDERVEGPWMRRLALAVSVLVGLLTLIIAVEPAPIRGDLNIMNPLALTALGTDPEVAAGVVGYAIAALVLITVGDAIRRWHRSEGVRRQQFRWFAFAVVAFPVLFAVTASDPVGSRLAWDPVVPAFFLGMNGVAVSIGVAVTRYRLYEIDRVVNRAVVYTVLTATLIGVYELSVIGLQRLLSPVTSGSDLAVAASTLAVAAAFGPLRGRVQRFVDRRFDREQFDASRTVGTFGQRLRDEVDLVNLTGELTEVTQRVVRPQRVVVWLRDGGVMR